MNKQLSVEEKSQWIVSVGVFLPNFFELPLLMLSVFLLAYNKKKWYISSILKYLLVVFLISTIVIYLTGYRYEKALQQFFFLSMFFLLYEQFFIHNKKTLVSLFKKYIRVAYYICLLGLFQELVYLVTKINIAHLLPGYYADHFIVEGLLRVTSTLCEGGCLGTSLIPALVYLFYYNDKHEILGNKKWVVFATSLLTVSPFVYAFFFVVIVLKMKDKFKYAKRLAGIAAVCFIVYIGYSVVNYDANEESTGKNSILMRFQDTYRVITNIDADDLKTLLSYSGNASTSVIATNMYIALHAPSRLFGTGIGTNAQSYQKIVDVNTSFEYNPDDGYSLFNRILSEFGLFGICMYIFLVYKFFNRGNCLNICFFCMIVCLFCRGGNYMLYGTVFIHFFYYYTSKFNLNLRDEKNFYYNSNF